jgi:BNR repeat-like domain
MYGALMNNRRQRRLLPRYTYSWPHPNSYLFDPMKSVWTFIALTCICITAAFGQAKPEAARVITDGIAPALTSDNSAFYTAYFDSAQNQICLTKAANAELKWSTPTVIASSIGNASSLHIAAGNSGKLFLIWSSVQPPQTEGEILFCHSDDGGKTWSALTNISNSKGSSTEPTIAVGSNNSLQAIWREALSKDEIQIVSSSSSDGQAWSKVDTVAKGTVLNAPAITVLPDGSPEAVWIDNPKHATEDVFLSRKAQGVWENPPMNLSRSSTNCSNPHIVFGAKGKTFIAWSENGTQDHHVWCTVIKQRGSASKINISDGPGFVSDLDLAADESGRVAIVFLYSGNGVNYVNSRVSRDSLDEISGVKELNRTALLPSSCKVVASGNHMVSLWQTADIPPRLQFNSLNFSEIATGPSTASVVAIHNHHGY